MDGGLIGKGIFIRGELRGEDDLVIEGEVEGTISMKKTLTIESSGRIKADIETESITVRGVVEGNLKARDKITIHAGAKITGDMESPRMEIEDGAYYMGNITMV